MTRLAAVVLLLALVAATGCPGPSYPAPPDAVCSDDKLGELLTNFSLAFSAGFSASHARWAAGEFKDIKSGRPKAFAYKNVTFRKHQLDEFELHAARRRRTGEIILWVRCIESTVAAEELGAELSRVNAKLHAGSASESGN